MPHLTLNIWSFDTAFVVSTQTLHGSLYVSIYQLLLHFFISQEVVFICRMEKEQYLFLRHV